MSETVRRALCGTSVPIHNEKLPTPDGRFVDVQLAGPHMCRPQLPRVDFGIDADGSPEAAAQIDALCEALELADSHNLVPSGDAE